MTRTLWFSALWTRITGTLRQFMQSEYPQLLTDGRVGDGRASTESGWRELFRPEAGFTGEVAVREFDVLIGEDSPEDMWQFFEGAYVVGLLGTDAREELRRRVIREIVDHENAHSSLELAFPHRLLSVRRR